METKDMMRALRSSKGLSPAQVRLLSQTKLEPEGLLHLHESQKSLTKSSNPEGSRSHFGNTKESNSQ